MKNQILKALANSFVADSEILKQATEFLTNIRLQKGYCLVLMQIIDDTTQEFVIKQAAMIQLKNTIKFKWNNKKQPQKAISSEDKQIIKNTIVKAIIRCKTNYKLVKLYCQIIKMLIGLQSKKWIPIQQIGNKLKAEEDLQPVLNCLIAVASYFQFTICTQDRITYFDILKIFFPLLRAMLDKNQQTNLIYLAVKFFWKSVHSELRLDIRQQTLNWMPLMLMLAGLQNQAFDNKKKINQPYQKNSTEFFYYHSKKWATRILLRFIQKHAKVRIPKKAEKDKEFSRIWYQQYGNKTIQIIYKQLSVPCPVKVRYFQLKCFHIVCLQNPTIVEPVVNELLFTILPPYLRLKPEDQQLANSDPIQFLNKQTEPCLNFTNLKRVSTQIWVAISEIGHQVEAISKPFQPGKYFFTNLTHLKQTLEKGNALDKEMALYLLCQLRIDILKSARAKQSLPALIENFVLPEINNQIMFLRARAIQVLYQYGSIQLPSQIIKKATQGIYYCLTQDQHAIVKIKSAQALNCILYHESAKQLIKPYLKNVLTIYLKLLETYDMQSIVNSLQNVIDDFEDEIEPFALQLSKYILNVFMRLFTKESQQTNDQQLATETQLAASACLKTVGRIIDAPLSKSIIQQMQKYIEQISFIVFSAQNTDYIVDLANLLISFIYKVETLSPEMWFFYQALIYSITGIPKEMMAHIMASPLTENQKKIFQNIEGGDNFQSLQQPAMVLRNYIRKAALLTNPNADAFRLNILQSLLFLVSDTYKKGKRDLTGELQMVCCTSLLINYIQNIPKIPQTFIHPLYNFGKYNILKLESPISKTMNAQYLAMLIYAFKKSIVDIMIKENALVTIVDAILKHNSKLDEDYCLKRVNLGLCSLIVLPDRPQSLMEKLPAIFKTIFQNAIKSINLRLQIKKDEKKNQQETKTKVNGQEQQLQQQKHVQQTAQDQSQEEDLDEMDFWEQKFYQSYDSYLNRIDDVKYFQESLKRLQVDEPLVYGELLKTLPTQQLANLQDRMQRAIELFSSDR